MAHETDHEKIATLILDELDDPLNGVTGNDAIHTLASAAHRQSCSLIVVVERWWTGDKQPVRTLTWARRLSGNSTAIFGWARDHESVRRATGN
jgi:hypothetical protein